MLYVSSRNIIDDIDISKVQPLIVAGKITFMTKGKYR